MLKNKKKIIKLYLQVSFPIIAMMLFVSAHLLESMFDDIVIRIGRDIVILDNYTAVFLGIQSSSIIVDICWFLGVIIQIIAVLLNISSFIGNHKEQITEEILEVMGVPINIER